MKPGGEIADHGQIIRLHCTTIEDLSRDVLKVFHKHPPRSAPSTLSALATLLLPLAHFPVLVQSDTATVTIEELQLVIEAGSLGGMFTTVEVCTRW